MSIDPTLIKVYESTTFGVEDNTEGGDINLSAEILDGVDQSIFDDVSDAERVAGDVEYRKVFIRNENSDTAPSMKVWFNATPDNASTTIGMAAATDDGTVGDEGDTASYVTPSSKEDGDAISIGDLGNDEYAGIWIKRDVGAGALGENADGFTLGYGTT